MTRVALAAAKATGISVIPVTSLTSPNTPFVVAVDDFAAGAQITTRMLARMILQGGVPAQRRERNASTRLRGIVPGVRRPLGSGGGIA